MKRKVKVIVIIVSLVILISLVVGLYFIFGNKNPKYLSEDQYVKIYNEAISMIENYNKDQGAVSTSKNLNNIEINDGDLVDFTDYDLYDAIINVNLRQQLDFYLNLISNDLYEIKDSNQEGYSYSKRQVSHTAFIVRHFNFRIKTVYNRDTGSIINYLYEEDIEHKSCVYRIVSIMYDFKKEKIKK